MLCNAQLTLDHRDDETLDITSWALQPSRAGAALQVPGTLATLQRAELARRDSSNRQQLGWANKLWLKRNSQCLEIEVTFYILSLLMVNEISFVALSSVKYSDMPFITNH